MIDQHYWTCQVLAGPGSLPVAGPTQHRVPAIACIGNHAGKGITTLHNGPTCCQQRSALCTILSVIWPPPRRADHVLTTSSNCAVGIQSQYGTGPLATAVLAGQSRNNAAEYVSLTPVTPQCHTLTQQRKQGPTVAMHPGAAKPLPRSPGSRTLHLSHEHSHPKHTAAIAF